MSTKTAGGTDTLVWGKIGTFPSSLCSPPSWPLHFMEPDVCQPFLGPSLLALLATQRGEELCLQILPHPCRAPPHLGDKLRVNNPA